MTKLKFDNSNYQLIRNNKVVARAPTLKDLKVIVKNDLPLPPTPVKVFIIKTRDTKKTKMPIEVKCQRYTVTPTGVLVQRANDNSKIFTYTSDELSSAESNSRDLKSMMLHVENNLTPVNKTISYSAMLKDISKMSYNQPVSKNPVVEEPESVESKIHTPPSFDGPEFQLVKNGNVIATSDSYPKLLDIVHYQLRHPIKHAAQVYLVRVNKSPYLIGDNSKAEVKIERFHIQPDGEFTLDRGYKFPKISYSSSDEVRKNKHLTDIFNEAQKDKYTKNLKQSDEIIPVTKFLTDNSIAFEPVSEVKPSKIIKPEPEPKLFKIKDEEIKKLVDDKQYLLFVNNKEVLSAESLKSLKEKLKEEFDNPDKDIKGYIVKAGLSKEQGKPLTVNCSQYTITTNLNIVGRSREGDTAQTFTFSDKELKDNGFKLSHIKKMIKVIKNDLISFDGTRIPITDVLEAVKNAPEPEPKPSQVIQPVPVAEVKPVDKPESESFLDKEFEKIKNLVDVKNNILFVDNKPILSSPSLQELKQKLKKEFNNPKENIKANIISFKLDKNNKFPVMVNSSQFTITPRLQLFSKDDDNSQTFTYSEKELKDKGFNLEQLTKIQKVIKDNLVSFGERTVSITDVFDAVKNAPELVAEVKPVDKPTKYTPTKHIPESETFLDKEFEKIKNLVDVKGYNLFVNNKLVLTAPNLPKLKEKLKEEFENPKKDIKANIMSFTLDKNKKFPVMINSSQRTITPKLGLFVRDGDNSQPFTYTEKELKDNGFNIEQLTKIRKVIKDNLVSFEPSTTSITDVLGAVENAPESPLEEPKPSQVIQPVPEEIKVLEKDFRHDIISNSQKDSSIGKPPTFDYKNFQLIKNGVVIAKASDMKKLKEIVKKNTKPSLDTFSNVVLMKPEYNIEDSNHPIFVKCKQLTITPLGNLMEVETHNKEQTFTYSDEELDFLGLNDSQLQDMVNTLENNDFDSKETPVSSLKEDVKEEIPPVIPPKLKPVSNKRK